jgi:uncharacterized protein YndB with AHSA1/START domain
VSEALELGFTVACAPEHAFDVWAAKTSLWWPRAHSVSADPELAVVIEPRPGGRIYERTAAGVEHDWGEVTVWDPPHLLAYLWHLAQDRRDATEVEVRFTGEGEHTKVTIVHRGWEQLGARGAELRNRNRQGWAGVIPRYEQACLDPAS